VAYELVLAAADVGNVHVVGGRAKLFKLLASEDVDGDQVDLGVTVLAGLGSRHIDNLARAALDQDETVLAESRALHGVRQRSSGIDGVEGVLMLLVASFVLAKCHSWAMSRMTTRQCDSNE